MKSPFYFIVEPYNGKRYNSTKQVGGINLITSTSKEDHIASNRYAIVIETPINYEGPITAGDMLLVHHNVFKYYNDMKGKERSGKSFFKDDMFFIEDDQFFMYKQNGKWKSHSKYCMVKPIPKKDFYLKSHNEEEPLMGIVKYSNDELEKSGVLVGSRISFQPNSEYEFTVDDEKLYRMFTKNITLMF
jgi:hypothetical protein